MLEAKDIMTKTIFCIKKDTSVVDAIRLMAKNNISGIPVVEDGMTLVGICQNQEKVRERDGIVFTTITKDESIITEDDSIS